MARKRYLTPKLPALVGVKEACELLGVQKMTFNRWRTSDNGEAPYFDVPAADPGPAQGPVWVRDDLVAWAELNGRRRAPAQT